MGLQGEKKLEDILTGTLIGLARTTYSHLKTENTDRVDVYKRQDLCSVPRIRWNFRWYEFFETCDHYF